MKANADQPKAWRWHRVHQDAAKARNSLVET